MVFLAAQLLVDRADIRARYQYQYDFVLVDEYQDATAANDLLARLLAFPQDNLYLVGDENESIFETKGSLPHLMSEISIRLPNARCYMLEKNWRSHPVIVHHACQFLQSLTGSRIQKEMTTGWGAAPTTAIIGPQDCPSEAAECEWVADEVMILIDSGRLPSEIVVLIRENKYSVLLEEALSRRGVRCLTSNPNAALVPDEVGDVMAFLNLVTDPDGPKARESFERICQLRVKEIDPKLSPTIAAFAESNNLSYLKGIEIYWQAVQEPACRELEQLVRIIRTMHQEKLPPAETISLLKRTQRLNEYYKQVKVPPGVNYEPLQKLGLLEEEARKFTNVADFVKSYNAKQEATGGNGLSDAALQITYLPEAKGKEYPIVFLVGLANGLFPTSGHADLEEERRLFYVGMTRAKELLYLSWPTTYNDEPRMPSTFLVESRFMLASALREFAIAANESAVNASAATMPSQMTPQPAAQSVVMPPPTAPQPIAPSQMMPPPATPQPIAPSPAAQSGVMPPATVQPVRTAGSFPAPTDQRRSA